MLILRNSSEVADWISAIRQQICDAEAWGDFASTATNTHGLKAIIEPPNYRKITNLSQSESMSSTNGRTMTNTDQIKEGIRDELFNSRKNRKSIKDVFKETEIRGSTNQIISSGAARVSDRSEKRREKPRSEERKKENEDFVGINMQKMIPVPRTSTDTLHKTTPSSSTVNSLSKKSSNTANSTQRPVSFPPNTVSNVSKTTSSTTSNVQRPVSHPSAITSNAQDTSSTPKSSVDVRKRSTTPLGTTSSEQKPTSCPPNTANDAQKTPKSTVDAHKHYATLLNTVNTTQRPTSFPPNTANNVPKTTSSTTSNTQRPTSFPPNIATNGQKTIYNSASNVQKPEDTKLKARETKKEQKIIQKVEPFRPKALERKHKSKHISESSSTTRDSFETITPEEKPKLKLGFQPLDNYKKDENLNSVYSKTPDSVPKKAPKNTYILNVKVGLDSDDDTISGH